MMKFIIPSRKTDVCTRSQVLQGLIFSGHNNTRTETSFLINELYKKGETQIEQQ